MWNPSELARKAPARSAFKFLIKGGPIYCLSLVARYAPEASSTINSVLSEEHLDAPSPPVSSAALLVIKMGASDMHSVMAAVELISIAPKLWMLLIDLWNPAIMSSIVPKSSAGSSRILVTMPLFCAMEVARKSLKH